MKIIRYCERCNAEVADLDGFCVLGHPLAKEELPAASITELRDEIESAFETARKEVAEVVAAAAAVETPHRSIPPPPPPRRIPPPPPPPDYSGAEGPIAATDPISKFSPPPHMDWGPSERPKNKLFNRRRSSAGGSVEPAPEA